MPAGGRLRLELEARGSLWQTPAEGSVPVRYRARTPANDEQENRVRSSAPGTPPAPGTNVQVHLLVGEGRRPVVVAEVHQVVNEAITYIRLHVDDRNRDGARHVVDFTISGPTADVAGLLAEMVAAVEGA